MKWYQRQLRVYDLHPPGKEEFERTDTDERSRFQSGLGFNMDHLPALHIKERIPDFIKSNKANRIHTLIYLNVHWALREMVDEHPDWLQKTSEGKIVSAGYGVGAYTCVNSSFSLWALNTIKDIAAFDIDGIFLDGPFFNQNACFCEACREKFRSVYGYDLDDNVSKKHDNFVDFLEFKKKSLGKFLEACSRTLKELKPEAIIYMNSVSLVPDKYSSRDNNINIPYQDILGAEGGFLYHNLRNTPILKPGMTAKLLETQADGKPTLIFIAARWCNWNRTLLTGPESWILHAEAAANGANTWAGYYTQNNQDDMISNIRDINQFLQKNEEYLRNTHSLAKVALVWSGATANFYQSSALETDFTGEQKAKDLHKSDVLLDFQGWYDMLSRSHIIFDVMDDYALENKTINKYKTLILPNVSCMSQKTADRIKSFVENGGSIISSFDTSLYDEWGRKLDKHSLGELLGIIGTEGTEKLEYDHIKLEKCVYTEGIRQTFMPATNLHLKVRVSDAASVNMVYRAKQPSSYCDIMPPTIFPFMVENRFGKGRSIYFPGNIGHGFYSFQVPEYKKIVRNCMKELNNVEIELEEEIDSIDLSYRTNGIDHILHVINYTGAMTRPIEKVFSFRDVKVRIYDNNIKQVYDTKREIFLKVGHCDGYAEFILPEVREYEVYVIKAFAEK